MANVREAIEEHLEVCVAREEPLPQAKDIEYYIQHPDFIGWVWAIVQIDMTPYLGINHIINITMPEQLIKRIDAAIERNATYKNRSGFLASAAIHELKRWAR